MAVKPAAAFLSSLVTTDDSEMHNKLLSKVRTMDDLLGVATSDNVREFLAGFSMQTWRESYDNVDGEYLYFRIKNFVGNVHSFMYSVMEDFLEDPVQRFDFQILCQYAEEDDEIVNRIDNQIQESVLENHYVPSIRGITYYSEDAIADALEYINNDMEPPVPKEEFTENIQAIASQDMDAMAGFSWYDTFVSEYQDRFMAEVYNLETSNNIFKRPKLYQRLNAWNEDNRGWTETAAVKYMLDVLDTSNSILIKYQLSKMSKEQIMKEFNIHSPVHANGLFLD